MATCKDCIHSKVCEFFSYRITSNAEQKCKHFKDRSRFVELPCKVGDTIYFVFEFAKGEVRIYPVKVCDYTVRINSMKIHTEMGYFVKEDLNKDVFLTREEAEQALKEREENEN